LRTSGGPNSWITIAFMRLLALGSVVSGLVDDKLYSGLASRKRAGDRDFEQEAKLATVPAARKIPIRRN